MNRNYLKFKLSLFTLISSCYAIFLYSITGCNGKSGGQDDASEITDYVDLFDGDLDTTEEIEFSGCEGAPTPDFLCNPNPPSTLLPPNTTMIDFFVNSDEPATCGWSIGQDPGYQGMTLFSSGQGTREHRTTITGINPDPTIVNEVYIRCEPRTDFVLHLRYRVLSDINPSYPRTGNLWGWWGLRREGLEHCARIDLFLGADFSPEDIKTLRQLNPNILILTSINTVEHADYEDEQLPEDYYLHDVNGNRIEVWPGAYRLNLTKKQVAEYQAHYAYQKILDSDLMIDGCFFDNFFTSQSWLKDDIYGNPVQLDANEDGVEDDPAWLDSAWRDGVFHELHTWRQFMPHAFASGHLPRPPTEEIGSIFNGDSIGFMPADVIEGQKSFATLWTTYNKWWEVGYKPIITMVEASPPDIIAYGYDYQPLEKIPASTLEFARTLYPYMRFGLALTLMNDGYFTYEFGDTWHGNDWWYDELDYDLGFPCGPAERIPIGTPSTTNLVTNGGFEEPLEGSWSLWVKEDAGAVAEVARDTVEFKEGAASARIDVTSAGEGTDWHVNFYQSNRSIEGGVIYDITFWAKSRTPHIISVSMQKGAPDWRNYGLWQRVDLSTEWKKYNFTFEANETASDARIQFAAGTQTGSVWIDDVSIIEHPPDVFKRVFSKGMVILNGTRQRQSFSIESGYRKLVGNQAPLFESLIDDSSANFTGSPEWTETSYDSGLWKASGPFYHNWGEGCHQIDGTTGEAKWTLNIPIDDTYTIDAWWPAAPQSSTWSTRVVYEVVVNGNVISTTVMDQSSEGDQWHLIAEVPLRTSDENFVRIYNDAAGTAIADALYIRSTKRYNDGSPVTQITLEPTDGIILQRDGNSNCP